MKLPLYFFFKRHIAALLLCGSVAGFTAGLDAAAVSSETGVRLLQAQLPAGVAVPQSSCEQLARAVGRATLTHRADAPAILAAALTNGATKNPRPTEGGRTCECLTRIFRVSVAATPAQASILLETASALYPDCADGFATVMDRANDKNALDEKDGPAGSRSARSNPQTDSTDFDPTVRGPSDSDPNDASLNGDLSAREVTGLGFGNGDGPGFPGSPGFIGSPPNGGVSLPLPVAETSVVNG